MFFVFLCMFFSLVDFYACVFNVDMACYLNQSPVYYHSRSGKQGSKLILVQVIYNFQNNIK